MEDRPDQPDPRQLCYSSIRRTQNDGSRILETVIGAIVGVIGTVVVGAVVFLMSPAHPNGLAGFYALPFIWIALAGLCLASFGLALRRDRGRAEQPWKRTNGFVLGCLLGIGVATLIEGICFSEVGGMPMGYVTRPMPPPPTTSASTTVP